MKKYIAQSGIIREGNPYECFNVETYPGHVRDTYNHFERSVQSYATDLPDGEYLENELHLYKTPMFDEIKGGHVAVFVTAKPKEENAYFELCNIDEIVKDVIANYTNSNPLLDIYKQGFDAAIDAVRKGMTDVDSPYNLNAYIAKHITSNDLVSRKSVIEAIEAHFPLSSSDPESASNNLLTIIKNIN